MIRELDRLTARTFDVLVVGGGIYGLTIVCDAAQRGLSVALIEKDDFGSGSSFNHLRTIHGGLRYLQTLNLRRARESIIERRTLARIAPAALRLTRFVLPLTRSIMRGVPAMRAGLALDRLVASDRNRGVSPPLCVPPGRVLSRREARGLFPGCDARELTGAAAWYDYVTAEADRLTFAWAASAAASDAVLANHVEAETVVRDGSRIVGVAAVDRCSGRRLEIGARLTINATGAGIDRLAGGVPQPFLKAMNLVTRRAAGPDALGGRTQSGRHLFLVPWRGRALFGTWESPRPAAPDDVDVRESEVASFIAELNEAFPDAHLTLDDVTLVHRGIVPAVRLDSGAVVLQGIERVSTRPGLLSVAGTKYTTARAVAERIVDRAFTELGRKPVPCRTASLPLPYETGVSVERAIRDEMALTLCDAVVRRTGLGALGFPGRPAAEEAGALAGAALGWSADEERRQLDALRAFYAPITS